MRILSSHVTLIAKKNLQQIIMSETVCFDVVCLENVLLRHAFSEPPTTHQGGRFWYEMSTSAPLSDLSYNAIGLIFRIFIQNGSVKKTAKFQLCT